VRLVATGHIADDAPVARAVWRLAGGEPVRMLGAGARVTPGVRGAMARAGVEAVWIDDALSEGIEPAITVSDETYERAVARMEALRAWVAGPRGDAVLDRARTEPLAEAVAALLREVLRGPRLASHTHLQPTCDGDRPARRAVDVTILGLILGVAHAAAGTGAPAGPDGTEDRLRKLGLGLMLCDIGTALVPGAAAHDAPGPGGAVPGPVRVHPVLGARLMPEAEFPAATRRIVAEHHERVDGRGYPEGRAGDRVHPHAQIAQMAAAYDAMTRRGPHGPAAPRHLAWAAAGGMGREGAVAEDLAALFRRTVAPYPEGISVLLSDGRRGIVARTHAAHADRPTVRVTHEAGAGRVTPYDLELAGAPCLAVADALVDVDDAPSRGPVPLTA
jgi:hypothetical protein